MTGGNYIGLMSGTSIDAIDAVAVYIDDHNFKLLGHHETAIPNKLKNTILDIANGNNDSVAATATLNRELGFLFANASKQLLKKINVKAQDITAIASHGQTIRHAPPDADKHGYSIQLGDPHTIAQETGIKTVADFRSGDISAKGQGAPLAPAFHRFFTQRVDNTHHKDCAVVNIGGIANVTIIENHQLISGYDTGPGNILMDYWIQKNLGQPYDNNGDWARQGTSDHKLLTKMLSEPYLEKIAPKSTGRELFNSQWLENLLATHAPASPAAVQRSLLEFTAISISQALQHNTCKTVLICGGGAYNTLLMQRLNELLNTSQVHTSAKIGIEPKWMEAAGFAWLAKQRIMNQKIDLRMITGASKPSYYGVIYDT